MSEKLPPLKLVVQNGPAPGQVFTIDNVSQTIGRGEDCDISIPDLSLSRQHAQIRPTAHGYVLEDLASTNGSFVNESPVPGGTLLAHGDMIRLGASFSFKVDYGFGPVPVEPAAGAAAPIPEPAPAGLAGLDLRSYGLWLAAIAAGLLILLLLIGGLIFLRFGRQQAQPATPTVAAALPTPALPDTATPTVETPAPSGPAPTVTPLQVPGLAAAAASQQTFPIGALNEVDPFCERRVEVTANSPVFITWQQSLAEASSDTDYVAQWLDSVYYEISLNGRPLTQLNYEQAGSTLTWWSDLGTLSPGNHYLSLRWYADQEISTGLDVDPADGQMDVFGPGLAGESFCEIVVPEVIALATPTPEPSPTPEPTATPTLVPQVQAPSPPTPTPPPPPTATPAPGGGQAAGGPGSSGGYTLAIGSQHRYEKPWGAAVDNDICRSYRENRWDNSNLNFRGFHLELLLTNDSDTPVQDGWSPTYTTAGGQGGRFCYNPYPDGRGTEVMPEATGSVTFFALVPNEDYVNSVRLEVNGQVLQFCLDSSGGYCSGGAVASQPGAPSGPAPTPTPPGPPSVEAYVTNENDDCILYVWNVQNVKEIYFDDEGVAGNGRHRECDEDEDDDDGDVDDPILRIVHLDGRVEEIDLEPDDDNPYWRD